ncbi:unnamed protein product [Absidia cylindrospora]
MNPFGLSIFVLICFIGIVKAGSLPPVYKHGCVILPNQKIYCHGGAFRSNITNEPTQTYFTDDKLYGHHVYLDVSRPLNVSSANTHWQDVAPSLNSKPFVLEPRADFAISAINATSYAVCGGIGPSPRVADNQTLTNITLFYNSESNVWTSLNPLEGEKMLHYALDTQLFGQRATQMNDTEFFIFGGIPPDNNTIVAPNTTYVDLISEDVSWSKNITAWTFSVARGGKLFPDPARVFRQVAAMGLNSEVLNFGGLIPQNATNNYNYMDFMGYYTFEPLLTYFPLKNQTFDVTNLVRVDTVPEGRQLHTVTTIPNLSKLILYGGINDKGALFDFCWWYNPSEKVWEIAKFTNGDGPGRRFGHQAVLVGSEMLYIIGGVDAAGVTQSDVHILNVTSMTWLNGSYTNTYDQMKDTEANRNGSDGSQGTESKSLGGGAIAGIVIGCVAGVGILVAAAVIMRMQAKKKALLKSGSAPDGFTSAPVPPTTEHNMNSSALKTS